MASPFFLPLNPSLSYLFYLGNVFSLTVNSKINSICMKNLSIRSETIEMLGENMD